MQKEIKTLRFVESSVNDVNERIKLLEKLKYEVINVSNNSIGVMSPITGLKYSEIESFITVSRENDIKYYGRYVQIEKLLMVIEKKGDDLFNDYHKEISKNHKREDSLLFLKLFFLILGAAVILFAGELIFGGILILIGGLLFLIKVKNNKAKSRIDELVKLKNKYILELNNLNEENKE